MQRSMGDFRTILYSFKETGEMTNEELNQMIGECKENLHYYINLAHKREKRIEQLIKLNTQLEQEITDLKWELQDA